MEQPPQSSWGEYARLVLNELERLNKTGDDHAREIQNLALELDRAKRKNDSLELRLSRLDDSQNDRSIVSRVATLEDTGIGETAIKRWRAWFLVFALGLISSIVIPIVALILTQGGG